MSNRTIKPIVVKIPVVVGVEIEGFNKTQSVEIRRSELDNDLMVMVNGLDLDVAYVDADDLVEALKSLKVI